MTPAYVSPLMGRTTHADLTPVECRMELRAARRTSTNDSHTIYHYNPAGIVDYCYSRHQSFHGHGYITEFILRGDTLCRRTTHDNGMVWHQGGLDATCWMETQRIDLHFDHPCQFRP